MKNLFLLSFIVLCSIVNAQPKVTSSPQIAIKIEEGASIELKGIHITFESVIEDSRCPKYTNCIWEGRAIVQVKMKNKEGMERSRKIILGKTMGDESSDKILYQMEGYSIEVVGLNPYPEEGTEKSSYILLIRENN